MGWGLVVPSMCLPRLEENKHHGQKPLGGEKGLFHHTDYITQDLRLPPASSPLRMHHKKSHRPKFLPQAPVHVILPKGVLTVPGSDESATCLCQEPLCWAVYTSPV